METSTTYRPIKTMEKNCSPFRKKHFAQKKNKDFLFAYSTNLEKILKEEFKKQKAIKE